MNKNKQITSKFPTIDLNSKETIDYVLNKVAESGVVNFMLYLSTHGTWTHPINRTSRHHYPVLVPNPNLVKNAKDIFPAIVLSELKCDTSWDAEKVSKDILGILIARWQKHVQQAQETVAKIMPAEEIRNEPDENPDDQSDE